MSEQRQCTSNDLANANLCLEISTASGRVESGCSRSASSGGKALKDLYSLLASVIVLGSLGLVIEVAGVFDCDSVSVLGPIGAVALGDDLTCDTHCAGV